MKQLFETLTRKYPAHAILLVLPVLVFLVGTACRLDAGGPQAPYGAVATSEDAASDMENVLKSLPAEDTSSIAFTLSEAQITSYLADYLDEHSITVFNDLQVFLQNQQVEIYSTIEEEYITADTCLILQVFPQDDGTLQVALTSAQIGMIPVPESFLEGISKLVQKALNLDKMIEEAFSSGYLIETIDISNGMITVTGSKR